MSDRPIRALIVDDEPLARRRIRDLLGAFKEITIAGEAEDGPEAIRAIGQLRPDLVFLDVQMPGIDGFDVLEQLDPPLPLIVFTTAFENYAIRAFEVSAVDYLLKPIDEERFAKAIRRARETLATATHERWGDPLTALLARIDRREKSLRRIIIKTDERVFFVEARDVDWFEAAGNYVRVHVGGAAHLIRSTMQALEESLDRRAFVRVHRSAIVNVTRIAELRPRMRGSYTIALKSGEELELSPAYRDHLQAAIGNF
jgi:two-component system, LytTR family, response regulator